MEYNLLGKSYNKEINLTTIAKHFEIKKKFLWEDFLLFKGYQLKSFNIDDFEGKSLFIYSYGIIVYVNFLSEEILKTEEILKEFNFIGNYTEVFDDYSILVNEKIEQPEVDFNEMTLNKIDEISISLVGLVLSKSIALEKTEKDIEKLLDESENTIKSLKQNKLLKQKHITSITADIISFKYDTMSNVMILDKPNITWNNQSAENLYLELLEVFDIDSRYKVIEEKTNFLMSMISTIQNMTNVKHASMLEWIIIGLIAFEIIYAFYEKFI